MRITTQGVERMNSENSFLSKFKWEMGDIHTVLFPKLMLDPENKNSHGEAQPIENMTASEAAREVLYRRDITKELAETLSGVELEKAVDVAVQAITMEELYRRYNKYTDLAAFARQTRKISIVTQEALKKKEQDPKSSGIYERVIASTGYKDEKGKYHRDALDDIASIVGAINKKLEQRIRDKFKDNPDLSPTQIDALVKEVKDKKPIKGTSIRIAMEVLAYKHTDSRIPKIEGSVAASNCLYVASKDHFDKISAYIHTSADLALDYLELEVTHKVYKESSANLSKAKSGMNVGIKNVETTALMTNVVEKFLPQYLAYRKANPMTEATTETKVQEFRTMQDAELYSLFRSWITTNSSVLSEEEQTKFAATLEKATAVLDGEEIEKIVNQDNSVGPNTIKAGADNAADIESQNTGLFDGLMN